MKRKMLILSALAFTVGASFGSTNDYANLTLETNGWFGATVKSSTFTPSNASWSDGVTWSYQTISSKQYAEFDTDLDSPVTLTANARNSSDTLATFSLDLVVSAVPTNVSPNFGSNTPAFGFAVKEAEGATAGTTDTNFYGYVKADGTKYSWVKLVGIDVPAEGVAYTLTVIEDARTDVGQVQFLVNGNVLHSDTTVQTNWFKACRATQTSAAIDFYGNGYLASVTGDTQTVKSEALPIPGGSGTMTVSEQAISAFESQKSDGQTTAEYMVATNSTNNKSNLDNYILFSKSTASDVSSDDKVVLAGDAVTSTENSFAVKAPKINVPTEFQDKVTWTVEGSQDGETWSSETGITADYKGAFTVSFDKVGTGSGQYLYFRAKANITYKDSAQ